MIIKLAKNTTALEEISFWTFVHSISLNCSSAIRFREFLWFSSEKGNTFCDYPLRTTSWIELPLPTDRILITFHVSLRFFFNLLFRSVQDRNECWLVNYWCTWRVWGFGKKDYSNNERIRELFKCFKIQSSYVVWCDGHSAPHNNENYWRLGADIYI